MSKIGVVPALINYNLRLESLVHSVTVVDCRAIVFGKELTDGKYSNFFPQIPGARLSACTIPHGPFWGGGGYWTHHHDLEVGGVGFPVVLLGVGYGLQTYPLQCCVH